MTHLVNNFFWRSLPLLSPFLFYFYVPERYQLARPTATAIGRSTVVELEYISLIFFYKLILLLLLLN